MIDHPDYYAALVKTAVAMARDRTGHRGRFRYTPKEIVVLIAALAETGQIWVNFQNEPYQLDPLHPPGIAYGYGIVKTEDIYPEAKG